MLMLLAAYLFRDRGHSPSTRNEEAPSNITMMGAKVFRAAASPPCKRPRTLRRARAGGPHVCASLRVSSRILPLCLTHGSACYCMLALLPGYWTSDSAISLCKYVLCHSYGIPYVRMVCVRNHLPLHESIFLFGREWHASIKHEGPIVTCSG